MKLKNIEDVLEKAPFIPFDIHIDGKSLRVEHPDQVLFSRDRATLVIALSDNRFHIVEVERIEFLSVHPRRKVAR